MIKSMTGFGRGEYSDGKRNVVVEIKTVNHRYFDINMRMPRRYSFAEEKIKAAIKEVVKRGKVDVSISIENLTDGDTDICLNLELAKTYEAKLKELKAECNLSGDIELTYLASLPEVMKTIPRVEDEAEVLTAILIPTKEATAALDQMRAVEGSKLAVDILNRRAAIISNVDLVREIAPKVPIAYKQRLEERIADILESNREMPEERIAVEVAVFADKCNVDEELTRLDSHLAQLESIINDGSEPDGKKLDFLIQEMNRETNTIGSKANDLDITNLVIKLKAEIEKIREQVQNIE